MRSWSSLVPGVQSARQQAQLIGVLGDIMHMIVNHYTLSEPGTGNKLKRAGFWDLLLARP